MLSVYTTFTNFCRDQLSSKLNIYLSLYLCICILKNQIANIRWIMEKAREFQKHIYFCFIDYCKAFDCLNHSKLWKILKEMGVSDHLTCLLRNPYVGQEATEMDVKQQTDSKSGKEHDKAVSPCLFNLNAEYLQSSQLA